MAGHRHPPGDYSHKPTNQKILGQGTPPGARIPANLNVRPLKGPPMVPIKDVSEEDRAAMLAEIAPEETDDAS